MKQTYLQLAKNQIGTLTLVILSCFPSIAFCQGFMIGIPFGYAPGTAPVVAIDALTGVYSTLSTIGNSYNSLAQDSNGQLYAAWFGATQADGRVSRIDRNSGAPLETFNAITPGAGNIHGLSFNVADMLFAVVNRNDPQGAPTLPDDLYEIDLLNETTTRIGSFGFTGVQGLDFSPSGLLYAWDVDAGLLTVNPSSGAAIDVNPRVGGTDEIQSIVFAPDGRLFGARRQLFSIDPITGAFAPIGVATGPDIRGIEWIVPEPSISWLISTGLLVGIIGFGRFRKQLFASQINWK